MGEGLERYTDKYASCTPSGSKPGEKDDPYLWPWLGIAIDRGPDSWAGKQFLKYGLHCNVEEFPDQSHDNWNDNRMALRETGLWNHVLIMIIVLNLAHAPFDDGKWFPMVRDAFLEYHKVASCRCPIFLMLLPKILCDWNELHRINEPGIAQDVWSRLPDAWCWFRRGDKVGLCRFMGYMTSSIPFRAIFHTKLLGLIYLGTLQGWLAKKQLQKATKSVAKVKDKGADKKQTMKEGKQAVSKLFNYGNTVQLATFCMLEPETYFLQCLIEVCSNPLLQWHQRQNTTLRSCADSGPWFRDHAQGGFLRPLCEMFGTLWSSSGKGSVGSMGFYSEDCGTPGLFPMTIVGAIFGSQPRDATELTELLQHPAMLTEQERAGTAFKYQINLASNRVRRCFWAMRGWPAQSSLLGCQQEDIRKEAIATLREDYEGYIRLEKEAPGFFGMQQMSVFTTRAVKQVVEIMKARLHHMGI